MNAPGQDSAPAPGGGRDPVGRADTGRPPGGRSTGATPPPAWVVDGANVVGSRPDGWWKDRAAAASRLFERLAALVDDAATSGAEVVLVLEGAARAGVEEGRHRGVRVVHAAGEGDDTVVGCTASLRREGRDVVVVTADRGLRQRVVVLGAVVHGPSWLP